MKALLTSPDFCHIGYVVRSMERAVTQWTAKGADFIIAPTSDPIQKVDCALLNWQGLPIELVAPAAEDSPVATRLKKGGGLDHICLFSDDIDAQVGKAEEDRAIIAVPPVYGCVFDRRIAFVLYRTGFLLELMQRRAEGRAPRDPLAGFVAANQ